MDLTTAMLADGAQLVEGKLYVLGGQWDRITVPKFPAQHPSLAVVLVIKVEYNEAPRTFNLNIELLLDGQDAGVKAIGHMAVGHAAGLTHGAPQFAPIAITFNNLQFERSGRYDWVISIDGDPLGQIPLDVVQGAVIGVPGSEQAPKPD